MTQYISKSTLVTEIERRRDAALTRQKNLESIGQETVLNEMIANELNRIISFIDTLEVKEVDLDDKIYYYINAHYSEGCDGGMISDANKSLGGVTYSDLTTLAKHFFELGMSVSNKAQKGEEYDRQSTEN